MPKYLLAAIAGYVLCVAGFISAVLLAPAHALVLRVVGFIFLIPLLLQEDRWRYK